MRREGYSRKYYAKNKEKINAAARKRYNNNLAWHEEVCRRNSAYRKSLRGKRTVWRRRAVNKDAAFRAYGGYKCSRCGIIDKDVLNIDHIGGRKKYKHGPTVKGDYLYSWLKTHDYPKGFRVLCYNCNIKMFKEKSK